MPGGAQLGFEVTVLTRPFVAARHTLEKGNEVVFDQEGGRILSKARGSEIPLGRPRGCYVLNVDLVGCYVLNSDLLLKPEGVISQA